MDRIVIDRIDKKANLVILDIDGKTYELPISCLTGDIKEGDTIEIKVVDNSKVKERISELEARLFE